MTTIKTNGTTTVVSEVRGAKGLENTINNMVDFMKHAKEWRLENSSIHYDVRSAETLLMNEIDFDELTFDDMNSLVEFVKVVGLDTYSYYTITEYAYMYTKVLDTIKEHEEKELEKLREA